MLFVAVIFLKSSVIIKNTQKKKCIRGNNYSSPLYIDDSIMRQENEMNKNKETCFLSYQ